MLKRKEKNNKGSKSQLIIVGSFFILLSISIVSVNLFTDYINKQKEKDLIKQYYETEEYIVDVPVVEEEIVQLFETTFSVIVKIVIGIMLIGIFKY